MLEGQALFLTSEAHWGMGENISLKKLESVGSGL